MLTKTTEEQAPLLAVLLGVQNVSAHNATAYAPLAEDIFTLRMRAAYRCYGAVHPNCTFYLAAHSFGETELLGTGATGEAPAPPTGVLCVQGRSALYSGGMHDAQEMESFLRFLQVETFQSNRMLLPGWRPVPLYLMHLQAGEAVHVCAAAVDTHPDLWALGHSGTLTDIDPDVWYADVCTRINKGVADVHAIAVQLRVEARVPPSELTQAPASASATTPQYAATAGAYAIDEKGVYLMALETKKDYRGCGFGCTLISSLARAYPNQEKWLLCRPMLHGFYEQLGFVLARPVCEYHAP